jgi:hypothetical protein
MRSSGRLWFAISLFCAVSGSAQVTTVPKQGIRENDPRVHALTNARIVAAPGKTIEKGTVLIRDGLIVEVGADVKVPAEARVWDLAGKTIYPGFIDSYSRLDLPETLKPEPSRSDLDPDDPNAKPKEVPRESAKGTRSWNPRVTPERKASDYLNVDKKSTKALRDLGFTSALIVPGRGVFRGSSALINLQETDIDTMVVAPVVAQHIAFDFDREGRDGDRGYPNSLMGAIALIRQSFLDASWYQAAQDAYKKNPATTERPETNASLGALAEQMQRNPAVFETEDELDLLRALRIADEFKLQNAGGEKDGDHFAARFSKAARDRTARAGVGGGAGRTATLGSRAEQSGPARGSGNSVRLHHPEAGETGERFLAPPSAGGAARVEQGRGPGGVDEHAGGNVWRRGPPGIDRSGTDGESGYRKRRSLCR